MTNNNLIDYLHNLKERSIGLDAAQQKEIAQTLGLPLSKVAGVASFYSNFNGMWDGDEDLSMAEDGLEGEMFVNDAYALLKMEPDEIISRLQGSGLGGCGGSGFSVAKKWSITAAEEKQPKYIVCNCSEGEGDTYKDMKLLLKAPHAVIEGMLLCARVTGAQHGIIYVRAEYEHAKRAVEKAVEEACAQGVLKGFQLTVFGGAGAYVCGEETALLKSLNGLRGEPALKPPYPGIEGLDGMPTVINNAESFASAVAYLRSGKLSKLYTVSGCVAKPGVYELPYGTIVSEIAQMAKASPNVYGFQLGGAATGGIYGKDQFNLQLSFEKCREMGISLGTGSLHFFENDSDAIKLSADSIAFLASQSCGMCAPCRLGTRELSSKMECLKSGDATAAEIADIKKLCKYLRNNSRCALGQSAANAVNTALSNFPMAFEHLQRG